MFQVFPLQTGNKNKNRIIRANYIFTGDNLRILSGIIITGKR
jgi:hypothetical protein